MDTASAHHPTTKSGRPLNGHSLCSSSYYKIRQTGEWPVTWTQPLLIILLKNGNLKLCLKNRTVSLMNHASKVILRVVPSTQQAEDIAQHAGFRSGSSTTQHIPNHRALSEKYSNSSETTTVSTLISRKHLGQLRHEAQRSAMKKYNEGHKTTNTVQLPKA